MTQHWANTGSVYRGMLLRSIWLWAVPDIIIYNYHTLSSEPWNLFSSLYLYGFLVVSFPREWCHIQRWVVKIYTKIVGERLPPTLRRLKDKMHQLVYTLDYIVCAQSVTREDSKHLYLHDKPLKVMKCSITLFNHNQWLYITLYLYMYVYITL